VINDLRDISYNAIDKSLHGILLRLNMITDEQIDSLSEDNDIAFVQYETITQ
jgi:hypothetical protein